MRWLPVAVAMLLFPLAPAHAQISVGIRSPGVDVGIHLSVFPELVLIPGYPVYYAPRADTNYFFYDGLYWVFVSDRWYASSWYDGPWHLVEPEYVPLFVLRVPVRYYRQPPPYFRGWRADAPPRWGEHWGRGWERRRPGWDRWDRRAARPAAPLPVYQRQYSGDRYPREVERQRSLQAESYRYRPRESATRRYFQAPVERGGARGEPSRQAPERQRAAPPGRGPPERAQGEQRQPQQPGRPPREQRQPPQQPPHQRQQELRGGPAPQQGRPRAEPQDGGRGGRGAPQGRGGDDKNAERGPDRR